MFAGFASISTVTSSTVALAADEALVASLGGASILLLVALLVTKEWAGGGDHPALTRLSTFLNTAIVPLFVIFVSIVGSKVLAAL